MSLAGAAGRPGGGGGGARVTEELDSVRLCDTPLRAATGWGTTLGCVGVLEVPFIGAGTLDCCVRDGRD